MNLFDVLFARKLAHSGEFPPVIKRKTGNPIELTDAAAAPLVKCVTEIQGSQDLHGYDKPWVGGAGKNKLDVSDWVIAGADTQTDVYLTLTQNTNYTVSANVPNQAVAGGGLIYAMNSSGSPSYVINGVYSGRSVTVTTNSDGILRISYFNRGYITDWDDWQIQVEQGSTATSYAPYSNICPITAYTEGEIEVRGKNLVEKFRRGALRPTGVLDGDLDTSGAMFYAREGRTYVISSSVTMNRNIKGLFSTDSPPYGSTALQVSADGRKVWTSPWTGWTYWYAASTYQQSFENSVQIEEGTTATSYEAPNITTHTTTYPSAIYRGSEDVVNGTVGTTMIKMSAKWSDGGQPTVLGNYTGKRYLLSSSIYGINGDTSAKCNVAPMIYTHAADVLHFYVSTDAIYVFLPNDTDGNTDIEVAYTLKTPTTSSVTPTNLPIKSLSGYNHIESSTGDMVVDYITDAYQNFVDTTERALPNTRKGGAKALDIFMTLDEPGVDEPEKEVDEKEEVKK